MTLNRELLNLMRLHLLRRLFFFLLILIASGFVALDPKPVRVIAWKGFHEYPLGENLSYKTYDFENARIDPTTHGFLPLYSEIIPLEDRYDTVIIRLGDIVSEAADAMEIEQIEGVETITSDWQVQSRIITHNDQPGVMLTILPFIKHTDEVNYRRLISFTIDLEFGELSDKDPHVNPLPVIPNSVLSSGNWFKLGVTRSGIHRITYQDLESYGLNPASLDPRNIRLYGNGPGMLPEPNSSPRTGDLTENPIRVIGEEDGIFHPDDFILFYGASQTGWTYNPFRLTFEHSVNLYTDTTYYFLTADLGPGQRIGTLQQSSALPTDTITDFNNYAVFEEDLVNLIKSGKDWYGKKFDMIDSSQLVNFSFPDLQTKSPVNIKFLVAARSTVNSDFTIHYHGESIASATVMGIQASSTTVYARKSQDNDTFVADGETLALRVAYKAPTSTSFGWLNYIELNFIQKLVFRGEQLPFRNAEAMGRDRVGKFILSDSDPQTVIWEITSPGEIVEVLAQKEGSLMSFVLPVDSIRQFIAFNGSDDLSPAFIKKVENQNLHGAESADMIIVCPPRFQDHARRLADIHLERDQFSSLIVSPEQIYNEFSSGAKDIAAIRDFMRLLYIRYPESSIPKYLLLFGDGSFDPKERQAQGTDLIPTFQSAESLLLTSSFVSDDFYGLLDEEEGSDAHGIPDVGIGRFPISTPEEAEHILHKIEFYLNHKEQVLGDWRNNICFLADDEDINLHFNQAEELASYVDSAYNQYNIDKIYFDSFQQVASPSGPRYPNATNALNQRVRDGALIINYTGHGGETGWAAERVLEASDINSWTNIDRLPLFVTATCEFSRFDDYERTAAGELVFLNNNGGGIALITTTRLAFAQSNFILNTRFYHYVFEKINGNYPRLGDLVRLSKSFPENDNVRNIVLLGDPALQLAYPVFEIKTTGFFSSPYGAMKADTIYGTSKITVTGQIEDTEGNIVQDFEGHLFPKVYDKPSTIHMLVNDARSRPGEFSVQKNELFDGNVSVKQGKFTFSFFVPKDIALNFGKGRISYYAMDSVVDASGYYEDFIIGGMDGNSGSDSQGPSIRLFLNDSTFVNGTWVNSQPILIADLSDESGINALGNGIGHDIVATLDDDSEGSLVLNEYFLYDRDSYQNGSIRYVMPVIQQGTHRLTLKAWDLQNNSSVVSIDFMVSDSIDLNIQNASNYPNPFRDYTYFTFTHNQFDQDMTAEVWIYHLSGNLVRKLGPVEIEANGYNATTLLWDGTTGTGTRVRSGLYVYHMILDNKKNSQLQLSGKLIVLD